MVQGFLISCSIYTSDFLFRLFFAFWWSFHFWNSFVEENTAFEAQKPLQDPLRRRCRASAQQNPPHCRRNCFWVWIWWHCFCSKLYRFIDTKKKKQWKLKCHQPIEILGYGYSLNLFRNTFRISIFIIGIQVLLKNLKLEYIPKRKYVW